jgi:glycerol uptake facilitator-like aquaporin
MARLIWAELVGTCLLVATVVGSGIMATDLTTDSGLALLANALATAAMLAVLIAVFGPVSGAQFNPVVTGVLWWTGQVPLGQVGPLIAAQVAGGAFGTILAHAMFARPLISATQQVRTGPALWLAEGVATATLILVILSGARHRPAALPWMVALTILGAYWFTASTSFANPAVTLARALTDTFSGIRPIDVPTFVLAQIAGGAAGLALFHLTHGPRQSADNQS